MRLLTVEMPEPAIEAAVARGLLKPEDRTEAWPMIQSAYAAQLSERTLDWLIHNRVIAENQRTDTGLSQTHVVRRRAGPSVSTVAAMAAAVAQSETVTRKSLVPPSSAPMGRFAS